LRLPKICDKKVGHARADRAGAVERWSGGAVNHLTYRVDRRASEIRTLKNSWAHPLDFLCQILPSKRE